MPDIFRRLKRLLGHNRPANTPDGSAQHREISWSQQQSLFEKDKQAKDKATLLEKIQAGYAHCAAIAGYSNVKFPFKLTPQDSGIPHLELSDDGKMALVGTDRGRESQRRETYDIDMLLYWPFRDSAMSAGFQYAWEHEEPGSDEDSRRVAFPMALDIIGKLSPEWRQRLSDEQQAILRDHPFTKVPQVVVDAIARLRKEKEGQ